MQAYFEKSYHLRIADFDASRRLKPSAILDLFQCVASEHAEQLGIGLDRMLGMDLLWVIVRVRYEALLPVFYGTEDVTVRTWPLPPFRSGFQREYTITDKEGRLLLRGSSDWVLMHRVRRRLMPVRDVYPTEIDFLTEQVFEGKNTPITEPHTEGEAIALTPHYPDLDMNGHVNNTRYADFALSAFPPRDGEAVRALQIDFHREVPAERPLLLTALREGDLCTVAGRNEEGERMFTAAITFTK